jgi:tetratricopeptide (TPR) repeat protein
MKILQVILTLLLVSLTPVFGETSALTAIDSEGEVAKSPEYQAARAAEKSDDGATMLSQAKTLVQNFPHSGLAHKAMSDAYYYMGFLDEAVTSVETAIMMNPEDPIAWRNLGHIRGKQKKPDEAEVAYKKAVNAAKDDPTPWADLAMFYSFRGNNKFAQVAANSASLLLSSKKYDSHHGEAPEKITRKNVAMVFVALKSPGDAVKQFKQALILDPLDDDAWCWLSRAYHDQNDKANALSAIQQALKLNPNSEAAKQGLQYLTNSSSAPQGQPRPPTLEQQAQALEVAKSAQELRNLQMKQRQMQQELEAQRTKEMFDFIKQLEQMSNQPRRR